VPNRRDALKGLGALGASVLLRIDAGAQGEDLIVAGQRVELRVASISPRTVRISVIPRVERPASMPTAASSRSPSNAVRFRPAAP
jgi:hypothetical protein